MSQTQNLLAGLRMLQDGIQSYKQGQAIEEMQQDVSDFKRLLDATKMDTKKESDKVSLNIQGRKL